MWIKDGYDGETSTYLENYHRETGILTDLNSDIEADKEDPQTIDYPGDSDEIFGYFWKQDIIRFELREKFINNPHIPLSAVWKIFAFMGWFHTFGPPLEWNKIYLDNKNILDNEIFSLVREILRNAIPDKDQPTLEISHSGGIDLTPYNAVRFMRGEMDKIIPYFIPGKTWLDEDDEKPKKYDHKLLSMVCEWACTKPFYIRYKLLQEKKSQEASRGRIWRGEVGRGRRRARMTQNKTSFPICNHIIWRIFYSGKVF